MSNSSPRAVRTRREILDAAWTLIAERGARVSMADVAEAVGMTRQSVYLHFGSRAGLLMALVHRADERFEIIEQLEAALEVEGGAARLDACLGVWLDFVPKIHPVARHLIRIRADDADAAEAWGDRMKSLRRLFRLLVRSLRDEGVLDPGWTVSRATDYLWAGCSVQVWDLLVVERGWSHAQARASIRAGLARVMLQA